MARQTDLQLDQLERMAAQTHPEVLPMCVDTLARESDRLQEAAERVHEIYAGQARTALSRALAGVLSLGVFESQIMLTDKLTEANNDSRAGLALGAVAIGTYTFASAARALRYRTGLSRTRQRARVVGGLYEQAALRAESLGLTVQTRELTE